MNSSEPRSFPILSWIILFLIAALLLGAVYISFHRVERRTLSKELPIAEVPNFSFTTQEGKAFTKADLVGKIWVIDFIFTRCVGPCPLLTSRMIELASKLSNNQDVKLMSITVDPLYDTPEVLARYASNIHANSTQWIFLTGSLPEVTSFIMQGMKQPLITEPGEKPTHSTHLMVVDSHGRIRTYYDGNDPEVIQKVLIEIGNLLREHVH